MSTQYRLVQSGKTASGGCSAGQGSSEPVAPRIIIIIIHINIILVQFVSRNFRMYVCILQKPALLLIVTDSESSVSQVNSSYQKKMFQ
jgi:hypothetical protein